MRVVVEGTIYGSQVHGGITRIANELLPRLCDLDPELCLDVLAPPRPRQPIPLHPAIHLRPLASFQPLLRPRRLWRWIEPPLHAAAFRLAVRRTLGRGDGALWHALYYRLPGAWDGPHIVTLYDLVHERLPQLFRSPRQRQLVAEKHAALGRADAILCISEATRADLLELLPVDAAKVHVTPLAASAAFRRCESLPPAGERPFLLYLGNRSAVKSFPTVLAAYARWRRRGEVRLRVVGPPWTADEKHRLGELGLAADVDLQEPVDDLALARLYNTAAAFLYPSLAEGFGIPLVEAMACGCPIVASRIPSTLEVAGTVPHYGAPGSVEELTAALDAALEEGRGERQTERQTEGIARAAAYSWDRTARATLAVYRSLARGGS